MIYKVLDVSKYQGKIDFKKLKATGILGIIIRAGYRGWGAEGTLREDERFKEYVQGCIDNDIPYGVYFFSQAVNEEEAVGEADMTVNLVKGFKIGPLFPVYIDTEWGNIHHTGRADKLTREARTNVVKAFCERVEKAGYYAGVYASTSFYANQLYNDRLVNYTNWVADYRGKCYYAGNYDMWQYSSTEYFDGILTRVDANECYKNFPAIIRKAGLNGYGKGEEAGGAESPEPEADNEKEELRKENQKLKRVLVEIENLVEGVNL